MTWEGAEPSGPRDGAPLPLEPRRTRRAARRATLDELLQANADARDLIRVLRGQLARYEQLIRVDSWYDVVTVVAGSDLAAYTEAYPEAACGHRRGAGECDCPEAG